MSSLRRSTKTTTRKGGDAGDIENEKINTSEEEEEEDGEKDDDEDEDDNNNEEVNDDETGNDEDDDDDDENEDDEPIEDNVEEERNVEKDDDADDNVDGDVDDVDDDDDDDELGSGENDYLQKFTSEKNKNYIKDFHPELSSHNYEEVKLLSIITRDTNGIIIDSLHKTIPILTKFEKTRILGQRAKQIDCGATPFVDVPKDILDGYLIAKLELAEKKIPFIIKRPIPNGGCEYWNVNDLEDL